uniref:Ribonuclease H n=1 Tax=Thermus thermophilus (strain ATCC 27634 / DSM 579 / HB8) TaxID=300852 RepID=UPI000198F7A3|nr:Chain A, Ribonuclease H [Thermus thermophilus HB8]
MNPSPRKRVALFTDGAALGNPGPGTTNNRMELKAAIEGLKALKEPAEVDLYTDSHYLKKAFTEGWLEGWRKRGWRTAEGKPVKNRDLWEALLLAMAPHRVRFHFVKHHHHHH